MSRKVDPDVSWHVHTCDERRMAFSFEPEMQRLEEEREARLRSVAPRKKKPVVCLHWLRGLCHLDEITCGSLHVYEPSLFPVCHFFNKDGGRCNNPDCIFRHPSSLDGDLICVAYARGFCEQGEKCPHRHIKRRKTELERRDEFIREAQESHRQVERRAERYQPSSERRFGRKREWSAQSSKATDNARHRLRDNSRN